jgi:hypothetical protein
VNITKQQIARANKTELESIMGSLIVSKMKIDRFFSIFLDKFPMDADELDTPVWKTYKMMLEEYDRIKNLTATTEYYLSHA